MSLEWCNIQQHFLLLYLQIKVNMDQQGVMVIMQTIPLVHPSVRIQGNKKGAFAQTQINCLMFSSTLVYVPTMKTSACRLIACQRLCALQTCRMNGNEQGGIPYSLNIMIPMPSWPGICALYFSIMNVICLGYSSFLGQQYCLADYFSSTMTFSFCKFER